ncbi:acetate/propionate family kinase [Lactobacillus sp. S2-2]|uniref:acetate/propionate family kinase n=1 Tax=Lactobacillus sp. S2-2 TaxID=2692917 RepID=UPI001F2287FD|nr:acetate kinase [Lactobacillus sp. S2-2]MCF6515834.1 acetate/propionate family kinase [Lactobacillus sp. S2-2]
MEKIIAINAGSSTLKFKLFAMPDEKLLVSGAIERIGLDNSQIEIKYGDNKFEDVQDVKTHDEAIKIVLDKLLSLDIIKDYNEITGVGHRIVAGGEFFKESVVIDDDVIKKIEELTELAPLHEPANLMGIRAFKKILPNVTSVAVFDTSFHNSLPEENFMYSIPYEFYKKYGARKYGAHGTSYRYVSQKAANMLGKPLEELKLIVLHLGAGASVCAIKDGKSYDTSMGFTPLAGLTMATRSGDIDPSLLPFLMKKEGIDNIDDMMNILNKKSGLVGVSEVSADMRDLEKVQAENHKAKLARDIWMNRVIKYIGSYAAEMNGLDAIVFTAGVGENDIMIREEVTEKLSFLGISIDTEKNNVRGKDIDLSSDDAKVKTLLVPTNEELMIVRDVQRLEQEK